ncbi:MAG: cell division protein FtsB [Nitrincola lacisaponensis]|uniref:Cell division protein FtsB n=1 Tax=Nitrincola lacisaponensis TaxID=267850 RepID=A0A063Y2I2_9GAMM|nr:cell division protein FtsB [Nitrincola lacisaponensis]KDE40498.1 Cell division protein DivIC (FtsB), stabilizes FtsL against RasP cleavage [Nitrincola lacisaponensis]
MFRLLILGLLLLLAGLQYRLWLGDPNLRQVWQLEQAIIEQRRENQLLTERNQRLEAEVADLKQGLKAIEERARSEMGLIQEGETFFRLIEPGPTRRPQP